MNVPRVRTPQWDPGGAASINFFLYKKKQTENPILVNRFLAWRAEDTTIAIWSQLHCTFNDPAGKERF
jgi:hypothetical protein